MVDKAVIRPQINDAACNCRMQDAEACFMIAARNYTDKTAAVSQYSLTI